MIAAIVIANALLGFWQERKAQHAVDALRDLTQILSRQQLAKFRLPDEDDLQ